MTVSSLRSPASGAGDYTYFSIYGDNLENSTNSTYQPAGTVTITESSTPSTTIKNPTSVNVIKTVSSVAPSSSLASGVTSLTYSEYDSTNETLKLYKLGYTSGASISTSNVSVKKGDASYTATFAGKYAKLYTNTKITADNLNITGRPVYLTAHGTPSGSFVANQVALSGTQETWDVNPKTS
jgi:hypothetical protein